MKRTSMTKTETIEVQLWKVGSIVVAKDTEFGLTEDKTYQILNRGKFGDCFEIIDDSGEIQEYSQEYFDLVIE